MKTWVKLTAIFVPLAALGGWTLVEGNAREARMTATAAGVLNEVKLVEDTESSSLDETRVSYTFHIGEQQVQGTDALPGNHAAEMKPGQPITVCYNPADPAETDVQVDPKAKCGA